ncbi:MAG: hypothetical protein LBS55_06500 [Prevotellaceae bacterium]|jgi:hypothetical protein|nr:hypothetical protein [Prevotellaceae bacterium]
METLGMSYGEVLHTPYSLLLMMQNDKIRIDYSDKSKEGATKMSGKEMLKKKRK